MLRGCEEVSGGPTAVDLGHLGHIGPATAQAVKHLDIGQVVVGCKGVLHNLPAKEERCLWDSLHQKGRE